MTIEQQQDTVAEVIPALTLIDPEFSIAGGAPRDWFLGNECSNVDVYLRPLHLASKNINTGIANPLSDILGVEIDTLPLTGELGILTQLVFEYNGLRFNLRFVDKLVKKPSRVISEFDYDICAIEYDPSSRMPIPTRQFFRAVSTKEIQYEPKVTKKSPRYQRMVQLFPEYTHTFLKEEDRKAPKLKKKYVPNEDFKFTIQEDQVVEFG